MSPPAAAGGDFLLSGSRIGGPCDRHWKRRATALALAGFCRNHQCFKGRRPDFGRPTATTTRPASAAISPNCLPSSSAKTSRFNASCPEANPRHLLIGPFGPRHVRDRRVLAPTSSGADAPFLQYLRLHSHEGRADVELLDSALIELGQTDQDHRSADVQHLHQKLFNSSRCKLIEAIARVKT